MHLHEIVQVLLIEKQNMISFEQLQSLPSTLEMDTAALQAMMLQNIFLLYFKLKLRTAGKTGQAINEPDTYSAVAWQNYCSENEIMEG